MPHSRLLLLGILIAALASGIPAFCLKERPLVVAYVFPQNTVLQPGQIDPSRITRVNFAFANIKDGKMVLGFAQDATNLAYLTGLKKQNPSLTILLSVGGWLWSGGFSAMASTPANRATFIDSAVSLIHQFDLDGLDIDWEYPGMPGAGHPFLAEDKQHFTALLAELRERLDAEGQKSGRKMYLTIAAGASDEYLAHTEMGKVQQYVDTVNLMAYDYYEPGSNATTGNHAPLYTDPADPIKVSADDSVRAYEAAGVPAAKIVLGVPWYGHGWSGVSSTRHGLFQPGKPLPDVPMGFGNIDASMLGHGYTRYWDAASSVPYLYNPAKHIFVSYEDEQSIAIKCRYILSHKLGGVMFWDYASDPTGKLLRSIDAALHEAGDVRPPHAQ